MTYRLLSGQLPLDRPIMRFVSFDPGQDNFSIRIEQRRCPSGSKLCSSIVTLVQELHSVDFESPDPWLLQVHQLLDAHAQYYTEAGDFVLIEEQMHVNTRMKCMEVAIASYYILKHPRLVVVLVSPKLKSKIFATDDMTHAELKKWSPKIALKLCKFRGDERYMQLVSERGKNNEHHDADTLVQIEAFCVHANYPTTELRRRRQIAIR